MKFLTYSLLTLALIPSSLFAATLTGAVHRSDSTTRAIAGAKVVVLLNNAKVDSTTTNASGQYTLTLTAGTNFTLQFSAVGFKDSLGYAVRSIMIALTAGANILNVNLTPATSTICGTVSGCPFNVTIVLQRRIGTTGSWLKLDSILSDEYGFYIFSELIAATGTGDTAQNYRLIATPPAYSGSGPYYYPRTIGGFTLAAEELKEINITIPHGDPILMHAYGGNGFRFFTTGDQLAVDLDASNSTRIISIFNLNGALQHQVSIPAGKTQVFVPATFAPENGFLFLVK